MNVNFSKEVTVIIRDEKGQVTDKFIVGAACLTKEKGKGSILELNKAKK